MRFFIPALSLFPRPAEQLFELAARAGFDGVEVLLSPHINFSDARSLAKKQALMLQWHEVWSLEDDRAMWFNWIATLLGKIPYKTEVLEKQLPPNLVEPVVAYAHRLDTSARSDLIWFQTALTQGRSVSYEEFVREVRNQHAAVVFDTQHVLELKHGVKDIDKLAHFSASELQETLMQCWKDLGPYVQEIHFNNFQPKGGRTSGRNLLPDRGVLDLAAFAKEVRRNGWDGIVTPEVTPASVSDIRIPCTPFGLPTLAHLSDLREMVGEMFA